MINKSNRKLKYKANYLAITTTLCLLIIAFYLSAGNFANINTYTNHIVSPENDECEAKSAEIIHFKYECGSITWSTSSEKNCSHFLVMFSRDKKSWNILGQVYGAGNSTQKNNYKYPTELKDVYFKLYQIDFDGEMQEYEPMFGSCKK